VEAASARSSTPSMRWTRSTRAEIQGEMGESHVGLQARLMSQAPRKLAGTLNRTETIAIFTNQLREKIGVMFGRRIGSNPSRRGVDGRFAEPDRQASAGCRAGLRP
jgi:RecA/RadA recombinase